MVPLSAAPTPLPSPATVKVDPRVPSEVDPFSDLLRAQIVCEILNTCGIYYVRVSDSDSDSDRDIEKYYEWRWMGWDSVSERIFLS